MTTGSDSSPGTTTTISSSGTTRIAGLRLRHDDSTTTTIAGLRHDNDNKLRLWPRRNDDNFLHQHNHKRRAPANDDGLRHDTDDCRGPTRRRRRLRLWPRHNDDNLLLQHNNNRPQR